MPFACKRSSVRITSPTSGRTCMAQFSTPKRTVGAAAQVAGVTARIMQQRRQKQNKHNVCSADWEVSTLDQAHFEYFDTTNGSNTSYMGNSVQSNRRRHRSARERCSAQAGGLRARESWWPGAAVCAVLPVYCDFSSSQLLPPRNWSM